MFERTTVVSTSNTTLATPLVSRLIEVVIPSAPKYLMVSSMRDTVFEPLSESIDNVVEICEVVTFVTKPLAATVTTGIAVAEP